MTRACTRQIAICVAATSMVGAMSLVATAPPVLADDNEQYCVIIPPMPPITTAQTKICPID